MADEELAPARVLPGVRHRQRSRDMLVDVLVGLALDGVARTARADAAFAGLGIGVAALDHEVRDHPMELGPVVEPRVRELLEVGDRFRHLVGEQLHLDRALGRHENLSLARHHSFSAERFWFTCATVRPTITRAPPFTAAAPPALPASRPGASRWCRRTPWRRAGRRPSAPRLCAAGTSGAPAGAWSRRAPRPWALTPRCASPDSTPS